jgi:hypothetical protein
MARKIKVRINQEQNTAIISLEDDKGNGIIVLSGKLGGCDFLAPYEQVLRVGTLAFIDGKEVPL